MTVKSREMFVASCDYPGCEIDSSDYEKGSGYLFNAADDIAKSFEQWDGGLEDWGWLRVGEKHYCGDHTTWDEETDERIPLVPSVGKSDQ